jgi:hypothetical protein
MFVSWAETGEPISSSQPLVRLLGEPAPRHGMRESSGLWLAYVQLDEPPGLSPITTVGRFATAEEALLATDEIWASR